MGSPAAAELAFNAFRVQTIRSVAAVPNALSSASAAIAESDSHRQQAQTLKDREAQLSEAGAPCPICRQPLGVDDMEHVREEYRAERKRLGECYNAVPAFASVALARAAL